MRSDPPGRAAFLNRLRRKNDIQRVFREGRRFHSPSVVLHARPRAADEGAPRGVRLTVVAGRQFPTAVARNRARRVVREASRVLLRDTMADWDLLLVARTEALAETHQERLHNLAELFQSAGLLADRIASPT